MEKRPEIRKTKKKPGSGHAGPKKSKGEQNSKKNHHTLLGKGPRTPAKKEIVKRGDEKKNPQTLRQGNINSREQGGKNKAKSPVSAHSKTY